jgi:transcription elongation factor B subunit 1
LLLSHRLPVFNLDRRLVNTMTDHNISYVKLISTEGHEFFVDQEVASSASNTIRCMLEGSFREAQDKVIRFPDISSYVLERVIKYMYYKAQYSNSNSRLPQFVIEPEIALELLIASKYLDC